MLSNRPKVDAVTGFDILPKTVSWIWEGASTKLAVDSCLCSGAREVSWDEARGQMVEKKHKKMPLSAEKCNCKPLKRAPSTKKMA